MATGLRKGELLGLQSADVDMAAARITVNHSLQFTRRRKGKEGPRWLLKGLARTPPDEDDRRAGCGKTARPVR